MPSASSEIVTLVLSRMRITTDSPWTMGSVTTRMSICRPSTMRPRRPSCGRRLSAMSRSAMILMRDTTPGIIRRGTVVDSDITPSTRKRTRISRSSESKWTSEAPRCTASERIEWTSLMTGASSADSRRSVTSIALRDLRRGLRDRVVDPVQLADQRVDVLARGHRAAHVEPGHHRDVVDREDVRRVRHGHEHGALVEVGDGQRLVAARRAGAHEVGGAHVHLEDREVHVVEPVALGHGVGQLVVG